MNPLHGVESPWRSVELWFLSWLEVESNPLHGVESAGAGGGEPTGQGVNPLHGVERGLQSMAWLGSYI